jgi:hypothetical protein
MTNHAFTAHSEGPDRTGVRALAQAYFDQLWIPTHLTQDQAREFVLDQFKRAVLADLELLGVQQVAFPGSQRFFS